ncbi:MAG: ATP-binding protein [bacterium]|nr:ATP-binding protein [bacterium]MDD3968807.1 ATP-binding protein [Proteiniphilum sp.]MDD4459887.1 ATP-binding protein [Proteiniphilum sp.]
MASEVYKQLIILNKIEELHRVVAFLEQLEEEWQLPAGSLLPINLVLEEALSNVIFYAYEDERTHEIRIDFEYADNRLDVTIRDSGKPFDPTRNNNPDLTLPVEERPIGGLGIFLIRKIMQEVSYERLGEENILRMSKMI